MDHPLVFALGTVGAHPASMVALRAFRPLCFSLIIRDLHAYRGTPSPHFVVLIMGSCDSLLTVRAYRANGFSPFAVSRP